MCVMCMVYFVQCNCMLLSLVFGVFSRKYWSYLNVNERLKASRAIRFVSPLKIEFVQNKQVLHSLPVDFFHLTDSWFYS